LPAFLSVYLSSNPFFLSLFLPFMLAFIPHFTLFLSLLVCFLLYLLFLSSLYIAGCLPSSLYLFICACITHERRGECIESFGTHERKWKFVQSISQETWM
jgi:hypothetical protein